MQWPLISEHPLHVCRMITNAKRQIVTIRPEIADMHRAIGRGQFANGTNETAGRTHFGWRHSHDGIGALLPVAQKRRQYLECVRQRIHTIGEVIEMRITFIVSGADHADARRRECIKVTHLLLERCVCLFQRLRCVDDRLQVHAVIAIGDLRAAQCLQNMHKLRD